MKLLLLISAVFLYSPSTEAQQSTTLQWNLGLFGRSTDDTFSSSRVAGIRGELKGTHNLSDFLAMDFRGAAVFETGSSSALFTDEFRPKSRLSLKEAALRWNPFSLWTIRGGALHQGFHESPLLIEDGTFPAARLGYESTGPIIVGFDGQGAIPVSESLSTRSTGKEKTPQLLTGRVKLGYQAESVSAYIRFTRFSFTNLTQGMAQDSRFYGNEISGVASGSRFIYQFQGWEMGPKVLVPLSEEWSIEGNGSFLHNEKGPKGNNQGIFGRMALGFKGETWSTELGAELYEQHSDAAPGFFSSKDFGHNNRKGRGATVKVLWKEPELSLELKARQSNLLRPSPFQKDKFSYWELSLEVPFAGF
jgi:hypothetical protein